jgi:multiple sugar transport system permease protein
MSNRTEAPPEQLPALAPPVGARRPPRARSRLRRWQRQVGPYLFVLPAVVFLLGLLIYPVLFNIQISFQDLKASNLLRGGASWVGLENYRAVITDPLFAKAALHSVVFTVVSVVFQIGLGLGLALIYDRKFLGASFMRSLFLVAYAVPIVVVGAVFKWLLDGQFGFVNWVLRSIGVMNGPTYWLDSVSTALGAVIMMNIWIGIPFNLIVLLAGLRGIPAEYYEAAALDGAGPIRRFRYITLPLLRPTMLAVGILGIIFTFKMFDVIWASTRGGPAGATEVLPTFGFKLVFEQFQFGKGAAVLNMMFVVLFLLSLAYLMVLRREENRT